jgi:single-stranded DNA-binding protein
MTHVTNQVTLIGNLGSDPKFFGNGENPGARFDLATNETFGSADERNQRTDWHQVICWGGLTSSASRSIGRPSALLTASAGGRKTR